MSDLGTATVAIVQAILGFVAQRGGDAARLAEEAGLDFAELGQDPDRRLPGETVYDLFERAVESTADPLFGLHLAEALPSGAGDVCEYAIRSASNVREALLVMLRYYALVHENTALSLSLDGNLARIVHHNRRSRSVPRAASELLLASIVRQGRVYTGRAWPLRAVGFLHAAPPDASEIERFFEAPVHFSQPVNELVFDAEWLDQPFITADPALRSVLERYADALLEKLPPTDPFLDDVRAAIAAAIRGRDPRLETTAERLAIGPRTLQRRLAACGTTHQELVEDVRKELATRHLVRDRLSISEVAYLLGFSDPSAFHRAFKRWTGTTPVEYRKGGAIA